MGVGPVASVIWYTEMASSPPILSQAAPALRRKRARKGHNDDQRHFTCNRTSFGQQSGFLASGTVISSITVVI